MMMQTLILLNQAAAFLGLGPVGPVFFFGIAGVLGGGFMLWMDRKKPMFYDYLIVLIGLACLVANQALFS